MANRKVILTVFILFLVSIFVCLVNASESRKMIVSANVLEPEIKFSIPDKVDFGDITCGYESEKMKIDMSNTGTGDLKVTVENFTDAVFNNLRYYNSEESSTSYALKSLSKTLDKPKNISDSSVISLWLKLDLEDLKCNESINLGNHQTEIIFWAMPK